MVSPLLLVHKKNFARYEPWTNLSISFFVRFWLRTQCSQIPWPSGETRSLCISFVERSDVQILLNSGTQNCKFFFTEIKLRYTSVELDMAGLVCASYVLFVDHLTKNDVTKQHDILINEIRTLHIEEHAYIKKIRLVIKIVVFSLRFKFNGLRWPFCLTFYLVLCHISHTRHYCGLVALINYIIFSTYDDSKSPDESRRGYVA